MGKAGAPAEEHDGGMAQFQFDPSYADPFDIIRMSALLFPLASTNAVARVPDRVVYITMAVFWC